MALNDKTNLLVQDYSRQQYPQLEEGIQRYIQEELRRIQTAVGSLANAAIQVTENPPDSPVKGMVRFNISPWDPLGDGSEGLVVYNGTAWVAV